MLMHVALQLGLTALSQLILRKCERVHCKLLLDSDFWNGKLILLYSFTCRYLNTTKKSVCLLQLAFFFFSVMSDLVHAVLFSVLELSFNLK